MHTVQRGEHFYIFSTGVMTYDHLVQSEEIAKPRTLDYEWKSILEEKSKQFRSVLSLLAIHSGFYCWISKESFEDK